VTMVLAIFAVIRIVIGLGPFVAAGLVTRWLGFPASESSTSAVVFARLFGVRDIGLGAVILWSIDRPELWGPVVVLNGLTDLGDLVAFLLGMRGRPDLWRPLGACAAIAGPACLAWGVVYLMLPATTG